MNPNAKNLPEFKKLIERYETITIEEIEEAGGKLPHWLAPIATLSTVNILTGFGMYTTCSLCKKVKDNCFNCVYGTDEGCVKDSTYRRINNADTPRKLLNAFRARAKYMRTLIEK